MKRVFTQINSFKISAADAEVPQGDTMTMYYRDDGALVVNDKTKHPRTVDRFDVISLFQPNPIPLRLESTSNITLTTNLSSRVSRGWFSYDQGTGAIRNILNQDSVCEVSATLSVLMDPNWTGRASNSPAVLSLLKLNPASSGVFEEISSVTFPVTGGVAGAGAGCVHFPVILEMEREADVIFRLTSPFRFDIILQSTIFTVKRI